MRETRARYFAENGFGDGGYDDRFVVLRVGGVPARDVHHVLTAREHRDLDLDARI